MNLKQAKALTFPCKGFYKGEPVTIICPEMDANFDKDFHGLNLESIVGSVCSLDVETEETLKIKKAQQARARINARAKHEALTGLGLTRVRGALGGIYYE